MNAAKLVFWLAAGALFYVYVGYPLLLALVGLTRRRKQAQLGFLPQISVRFGLTQITASQTSQLPVSAILSAAPSPEINAPSRRDPPREAGC